MEIEFSGAAREVTGSCHILRVGGRTVLLDCGLYQGRRSETNAKNHRLPVPVGEIDAVVLSHAHIDHAGRLPFLVREGYAGPIHCTSATRDLCAIMLADSAHIQEKDAQFLAKRGKPVAPPLYGAREAMRTIDLMVSQPFDEPFQVVPGVTAGFLEAGHILGSASVVLECTEGGRTRRVVFSGDIGRSTLPIIRDPKPPGSADVVIMESTYGNRDHPPAEGMRARLGEIVRATAGRGGRLIVPAFAVGRTQEIVYDLHALSRAGQIPNIPVYIDSPLAVDATAIFAAHPEAYDAGEDLVQSVRDLFQFELAHYVRKPEESKALNSARGPMVIISASGMAESGRILHHLTHGAPDPRNTILIVGFQAEHTLGRRIVEKRPMLRILGEDVPLRAEVEILNGYSAHADRTELALWLETIRRASPRAPDVWLVHGEAEAQEALSLAISAAGHRVRTPAPGERAEL